jgi:uncharacterized protein (TIGR03067 family)
MGRWLIAVAAVAGAGVARADGVADDLKALQGTWSLASYEAEGKRYDRKNLAELWGNQEPTFLRVRIEGDTMTFGEGLRAQVFKLRAEGPPKEWTFHLDPKQTPKRFDFSVEGRGPFDRGTLTIQGVYRLREGRLEVCAVWASTNEEVTDFTTERGKWRRLVVFERVKGPGK